MEDFGHNLLEAFDSGVEVAADLRLLHQRDRLIRGEADEEDSQSLVVQGEARDAQGFEESLEGAIGGDGGDRAEEVLQSRKEL